MADAFHDKSGRLYLGKNFSKEGERKVRFEGESLAVVNAVAKSVMAEKPRCTFDGAMLKDKQTGELLPFGEHKAQATERNSSDALQDGEPVRLKGKLKWLFEQDRMFWESNSAKSSRRGSPEVDILKSSRAADSKAFEVESLKVDISKKLPLDSNRREHMNVDVSNECVANHSKVRPSIKMSCRWNDGAEIRPQGSPDCQPKISSAADSQHAFARRLPEKGFVMSSLDLGGEELSPDYENAPNSEESSDLSSSDEDCEPKKIDVTGKSAKDFQNQATYLKAKCDVLSKEKDFAMREWKQSCVEIDQAARMSQALRSAIETLLEAGAVDPRADFDSKKDNLELQTRALKARMEKLRRKSHEGRSEAKRSDNSSPKETPEGRNLASPEVPRDTAYKVEDLRARLEKLMLATNSRVTDEKAHGQTISRETKVQIEDIPSQKTQQAKVELKMRGWFNSISEELTMQELAGTSSGFCEKCHVSQGSCSWTETNLTDAPLTSKQVSPLHPLQEFHATASSTPSSEETKKNVIHKIAEEVRLEAEQWFQVQVLLQRVAEDMARLQEACSTWERRAVCAEAKVACMTQEAQERNKTASQLGEDKLAELQKETSRLKGTVDEVRQQVGNIGIDPSRWFEAAHNFGYAFMPVNLFSANNSCTCRCNSKVSANDNNTLEPTDEQKQKEVVSVSNTQPGSSTNFTSGNVAISLKEKTHELNETRWRSKVPSQQWANEVARAEEEEILTSTTGTRKSKLEIVSSILNEDAVPGNSGKLEQKLVKPLPKDPGLESSGSKDVLLQMPSSTRERSMVNPDEQLSRYSNSNSSWRSPLRDVVENVPSAKENKRPF